MGSCDKRQKPQASTPPAPIPSRQTREVANAKVRNRYTNLTYNDSVPLIWWLRTLAFATFFSFGGYGSALAVFGAIESILKISAPKLIFANF